MDRLDFLLHGYDRVLKQFLVDGFRFGFRIHFVGERFSSESPNLKSALDQPVVTHAKLRKECDAGRIVGPFTAPPFPNFRCSPLGIVPKKDPSEFRLIHHLSYPKGSSVIDFIPDYCSTVKHASVVTQAVTQAVRKGLFYGQNRREIRFPCNSYSPC